MLIYIIAKTNGKRKISFLITPLLAIKNGIIKALGDFLRRM